MTIAQCKQEIIKQLKACFTERESQFLAQNLLIFHTKLNKKDLFLFENNILDNDTLVIVNQSVKRLISGEPLQYVLEEAFFLDKQFYVNSNVLIPRPETEELVELIKNNFEQNLPLNIIDIGTGSGCIPVSLKSYFTHSKVFALDVCNGALEVAKVNAKNHNIEIEFSLLNILNEKEWSSLPKFDVIVSNPPYIPHVEKALMHNNVLQHEPHLALFVNDEDVLIFYIKIAEFALKHLNLNGQLFFECNEFNATKVVDLLNQKGFHSVKILKDINGKDRMIQAKLNE